MTDRELRDEVMAELEYADGVRAERVGVAVEDGVVTLYGHVESYGQKLAVERAARRVYSARAIANDLEVLLPVDDEASDPELAADALEAIERLQTLPPDSIRLTVRHGHVSLEGVVDEEDQRLAPEQALLHVRGVHGIANHIRVREVPPQEVIRTGVVQALRGIQRLDSGRIRVAVTESRVSLDGEVDSEWEREEAELAAWTTPGVDAVENHLAVAA